MISVVAKRKKKTTSNSPRRKASSKKTKKKTARRKQARKPPPPEKASGEGGTTSDSGLLDDPAHSSKDAILAAHALRSGYPITLAHRTKIVAKAAKFLEGAKDRREFRSMATLIIECDKLNLQQQKIDLDQGETGTERKIIRVPTFGFDRSKHRSGSDVVNESSS